MERTLEDQERHLDDLVRERHLLVKVIDRVLYKLDDLVRDRTLEDQERHLDDLVRERTLKDQERHLDDLVRERTLEDQERHLLVKVIDHVSYKLDDLV